MSDLSSLLPDLARDPAYSHLLPTLDQHALTASDLLALDARTVAARTRLSVLDVARLTRAIATGLQRQLMPVSSSKEEKENKIRLPPLSNENLLVGNDPDGGDPARSKLPCQPGVELGAKSWTAISLLDTRLDTLVGGGIPTGYVTEIVGESGAGKTQLLLTLLLAAQLPPPHGCGRPTVYISTEHPLPTQRLTQLLKENPVLSARRDEAADLFLSRILTLHTPDLETQEHILAYQLPVAMAAHRPGLVVLDSIAANYRDAPVGSSGLAARAASLQRTGILLRQMAREYDCAIVISNHVADRFSSPAADTNAGSAPPPPPSSFVSIGDGLCIPSSSPTSSAIGSNGIDPLQRPFSSPPYTLIPSSGLEAQSVLTLDHQQRFFTGWGAHQSASEDAAAKTPALGLVWANQIAARIAVVKEAARYGPELATSVNMEGADVASIGSSAARPVAVGEVSAQTACSSSQATWTPERWRRWLRLVFAAWSASTPADCSGTEVEIWAGGVRSVPSPGSGPSGLGEGTSK